jgi:hypothetical protein
MFVYLVVTNKIGHEHECFLFYVIYFLDLKDVEWGIFIIVSCFVVHMKNDL